MWGFIKIRVWHGIRTATRAFNTYATLCDKRVMGDTVSEVPEGEPFCKACARIQKKIDAAQPA